MRSAFDIRIEQRQFRIHRGVFAILALRGVNLQGNALGGDDVENLLLQVFCREARGEGPRDLFVEDGPGNVFVLRCAERADVQRRDAAFLHVITGDLTRDGRWLIEYH